MPYLRRCLVPASHFVIESELCLWRVHGRDVSATGTLHSQGWSHSAPASARTWRTPSPAPLHPSPVPYSAEISPGPTLTKGSSLGVRQTWGQVLILSILTVPLESSFTSLSLRWVKWESMCLLGWPRGLNQTVHMKGLEQSLALSTGQCEQGTRKNMVCFLSPHT